MADVGSLDSEQLLTLLQEIGKAADKIKVATTGAGEASTKHFKAAGEAAAGMDKQIGAITKSLLGPAGLAVGFATVAKSLDNFAVGQLQLANLARNTGLAASSVLQLQTKFEVAGLGAEGFSKTIGGITSALNDIKTFQEGSPVFGKLSELLDLKVDGQQVANAVLGYEKVGDRLGSINTLVKAWNQGTARQKLFIEQLNHTDAAGMHAMQEDIRNVVLVTQQGDAAAKEYHKTWVSVQNTGTNIWNTIANAALTEIARMSGGLEGLKTKSESITKAIAEYFATNLHPAIEREMATIRQLQSFMEYISKLTEGRQFAPGKGPPGALTKEEFLKRQGEDKEPFNFGKWLDEKLGTGRDSDKLPLGARPRSYSPDDVDKDSNKVLHDIRDMMQRSELRTGIGGEGSSGIAFRPGIGGGSRARGGGGAPGGGGGGGPGGAPETTTGNLPDVPGTTANEGQGDGYLGRSKWASQLLADPAMRERLYRHSLGENTDPIANQAIMETARNRADIRENKNFADKGNLSYFAGYYRGVITKDMQKMLDHNFDEVFNKGSDVSKGAIDNSSSWLAEKHERTGRFKTVFKRHGETFEVPGWGESGRGERERYPEFRRRQLEQMNAGRNLFLDESQRSNFDKSMKGASVTGELNANVNFSNVPPGVKTNAEGTGFKKLRVTASKQGQKAAEGLNTAGDATYGTWVP